MSDFCLSCCSTVDLSPEWMKKRDLRYVCFRYTLDGVEYLDDMGASSGYGIGTTIGSHTGPGTVSLFFWGSPRVD